MTGKKPSPVDARLNAAGKRMAAQIRKDGGAEAARRRTAEALRARNNKGNS